MKIIKIDKCDICPYQRSLQADWCSHEEKVINTNDIPDWCPLDNFEPFRSNFCECGQIKHVGHDKCADCLDSTIKS